MVDATSCMGAQEARSAFDAISYALRSNAAAAACKAALPAPGGDGTTGPTTVAADALSTLQARQLRRSVVRSCG